MKINVDNGILHKFEKESSKLRMVKGGAWTINFDYLFGQDIFKIVYETSSNIYEIELIEAKNKGFVKWFKGEKKLVVPLSAWVKTEKETKNERVEKRIEKKVGQLFLF